MKVESLWGIADMYLHELEYLLVAAIAAQKYLFNLKSWTEIFQT